MNDYIKICEETIKYTEYIVENLNKSIDYSKYLDDLEEIQAQKAKRIRSERKNKLERIWKR